uniref:Str_synth domain-containing protein n=1 Tax=Panagrellus redivivus TaxID=6233 RepID=A0A7E4ZSX6_PANRE
MVLFIWGGSDKHAASEALTMTTSTLLTMLFDKNGHTTCRPLKRHGSVIQSRKIASLDILGLKHISKEGNTALRYEGFVGDFEDRAYVFDPCGASSRPLNSAT